LCVRQKIFILSFDYSCISPKINTICCFLKKKKAFLVTFSLCFAINNHFSPFKLSSQRQTREREREREVVHAISMESANSLLPLSNDVKQRHETEHKVPTMTRKGVYAALSYMASSGLFLHLQT
jgi:hypothetical protein